MAVVKRGKRKRGRRSSTGSLTAKNPKSEGDPADAALLRQIGKHMKGTQIEKFVLFEGGISVPPLELTRQILASILKEIGHTAALGEGM